MKMSKLFMVALIALLVYAFFAFDLGQYFSLDYFKSQQAVINTYLQSHPLQTASIFFAIYVAGTLVYVNAGTQIAGITSLSGILSPALIGSFVVLGLFPLLAKKLVAFIKARRVYRGNPGGLTAT